MQHKPQLVSNKVLKKHFIFESVKLAKKAETYLHALLEGVSQVGADVLQYGVATLVFAGVTMLDNILASPFSYAHHAVALAFHDLAHICCQSSQLESDLWDEADVHHTCIQSTTSVQQSICQ